MITFSIIVPVYNVLEFLERCIDSIVAQTYKAVEILLIDDGSTDGSGELCDILASRDSRICVYHKKNGGLSDARNFGLDRATGDYVIFLDSDDFINIELCQKLTSYILSLKEKPDIVTIRAANVVNDKLNGYLGCIQRDKDTVSGIDYLKREFQSGDMNMAAWLSVCRKEFLDINQFRFLVGILHEDEELMPRIYLKARKVASSNILGYYYVQREGSITQSKSLEKNAKALNDITIRLEKEYLNVADKELQNYLLNSLVTSRLNVLQCGKLIGSNYKYLYNIDFLKRNAKSTRNKCKVWLFFRSPSLYYQINRISKLLKRHKN